MHTQPPPDLRPSYARIRQQADDAALGWPHASKMAAHCHVDEAGYIQPPAFTDGAGPVGVYAMLADNSDAVSVLRLCRDAFDAFLDTVHAELDPPQVAAMRRLTFIGAVLSWHTCVSPQSQRCHLCRR